MIVEADAAPMVDPSIAPPLMSTVEKVAVPVAVRAENVAVPENAGAFEKTERPEPVSSERIAASCAEVVKDEPIPSVLVATHVNPVPVLFRTMPLVPAEFELS